MSLPEINSLKLVIAAATWPQTMVDDLPVSLEYVETLDLVGEAWRDEICFIGRKSRLQAAVGHGHPHNAGILRNWVEVMSTGHVGRGCAAPQPAAVSTPSVNAT
jgi:hypothetical protein